MTDRPEYEVRNTRASIEDLSPPSFTRVRDDVHPDCATKGGMLFSARVSDPDPDDQLEARVVINGNNIHGLFSELSKPGESNEDLVVRLCVRPTEFPRNCNRLELLVSRGFLDDVYATKSPDDLARVEWWVLGDARDVPGARPYDCMRQFEDAGGP